MAQSKFESMRSIFEKKERRELEELVLAYSNSHARICEISELISPEHRAEEKHEEEPHGHASEEEMRKRIKAKSKEELVDLLAGAAVVSEAAKAS
jgi:hypothetical protein